MAGSRVFPQFEVIGGIAQLHFDFFDVVYRAENNYCRSLASRLDGNVLPLSELRSALLSADEKLSGVHRCFFLSICSCGSLLTDSM